MMNRLMVQVCSGIMGLDWVKGIKRVVNVGIVAACGSYSMLAGAQTPINNVVDVSAGYSHTCALTTSGGVKCWGSNQFGQIGAGDTVRYSINAEYVIGLQTGVTAIATGSTHSCALVAGGVKCWGDNSAYQIGDNTFQPRYAPVDVVGLTSGVVAIAAGGRQTCALTNAGSVKCWGYNNFAFHQTPVDISGLSSGITAITVGFSHLCGLTSVGGVKCWGSNYQGQIGNGTTSSPSAAIDVSGLTSGVTKIEAGNAHTCAVLDTGGAKCWGDNTAGQLGNNTITGSLVPVDVANLNSTVVTLSAGNLSTCALTINGGVKCWGDNSLGQLGINSTLPSLVPVDVYGYVSGINTISVNEAHACAVTINGEVNCWGDNSYGRLGDGSTLQRLIPSPANTVSASLPNNCISTPLSLGATVNGTWGQVNDCTAGVRGAAYKTDSYSFVGQAGQRIAIPLSSSNFNTFLYLRDPNGLVIGYDDDGGTNPVTSSSADSRIPAKWGFFTLDSSGTYLVEVTSSSTTNSVSFGAYSFSLTLGAPLSSSSVASSIISSVSSISSVASSSVGSSTASNNSLSSASLNSSSSIALSSSVSSSAISSLSSSASSNLSSSVSSVVSPCATVTPTTFGTTYSGSLVSGDCTNGARATNYYTDKYSFSVTAGQQVSILLTSSAFDSYVYLKNSSGTVIASDDDGGGSRNSRIPATSGYYTLSTAGTYTVEVTSYSTFATGAYSLLISTNGVAASSSSSSTSSSSSSSANTCISLTTVAGVTNNGALASTDCTNGASGTSKYTDRYTFNAAPGQQISILLTSTVFDTYVYLKNPSGSVINSDDDGGGGHNSRIPAGSGVYTIPTGTAGTYVIEVSSYSTFATGSYSLLFTSQ